MCRKSHVLFIVFASLTIVNRALAADAVKLPLAEGVELQPHPQAVEAPGETNGGRAHAQPAAPPPAPSSR